MASKKKKNRGIRRGEERKQSSTAQIAVKGDAVKGQNIFREDQDTVLMPAKVPIIVPKKAPIQVFTEKPILIPAPPITTKEVEIPEERVEGYITGFTRDGEVKILRVTESPVRATIYLGKKLEGNPVLYQVVEFTPQHKGSRFLAADIKLTNRESGYKNFVRKLETEAVVTRPDGAVTYALYEAYVKHLKEELDTKNKFEVYLVADGRVTLQRKPQLLAK